MDDLESGLGPDFGSAKALGGISALRNLLTSSFVIKEYVLGNEIPCLTRLSYISVNL